MRKTLLVLMLGVLAGWAVAPAAHAQGFLQVPGSPFALGGNWLTFSPDGRFLAGARARGGISVAAVNRNTDTVRAGPGSTFARGTDPLAVAYSRDGRWLVAPTYGNRLLVFSVNRRTGSLRQTSALPIGDANSDSAISFSPNGRLLAVGDDDGGFGIFAFNPTTGTLRAVSGSPFATRGFTPSFVVFSPRRNLLAADEGEGVTIFRVNPDTGAPKRIMHQSIHGLIEGPGAPAFSPDGHLLAVPPWNGAGVSVFSVNPRTGHLRRVPGSPFRQRTVQPQEARAAAFSPDGSLLAVSNIVPASVSVFSVNKQTGTLRAVPGSPFTTPGRGANAPTIAAFSPDGGLLAVGDWVEDHVWVFSVGASCVDPDHDDDCDTAG